MRAAAAPQQQPGFRRLATFQGVSAFWARGGEWRAGEGRDPLEADVSARYVRSASAPMKEASRAGVGSARARAPWGLPDRWQQQDSSGRAYGLSVPGVGFVMGRQPPASGWLFAEL